MDRSRIAATVPGVVLVRSLMGVEADVVLVDVSHSALVAELRAVRAARIVGYAPHVDDAARGAALAAGCTEVLARSVFFHRLSHLVAGQHPPAPSQGIRSSGVGVRPAAADMDIPDLPDGGDGSGADPDWA
jgi:hypothetical protein